MPELEVLSIDSTNKKVKFVQECIKQLDLKNVFAIHGRAEELSRQEYREKFDVCVSRAVAALPILLEYCLPFVKPQGYFVAYKAATAKDELEASKRAISLLSAGIVETDEFILPFDNSVRNNIILLKTDKINAKYPRNSGSIKNKPL